VLKVSVEWTFYACIFLALVRSYRSEVVGGLWFGRELSIFEWHSECNAISISNPVRQPLQTSINKLNVFKSFPRMLAPPSTLLSNTMKFARINARSFKDVLASMFSGCICHHSSNIKTNSFPPPLRVYDTPPGSPEKADHVSKNAKINHIVQ